MLDRHGREVIVEDEAQRCPRCDGTGEYLKAAHHASEAEIARLGDRAGLDLVPCGYCKASGRRG